MSIKGVFRTVHKTPCKSRRNVERVWDAFCSGARVVGVSTNAYSEQCIEQQRSYSSNMECGPVLESVREHAGAGAQAAETTVL